MKCVKHKFKIVFHLMLISLFLLGIIILHVDQNYEYETRPPLEFFGIPVSGSFIFDIGILLVSISFLLEFYLTFKPIKILTEEAKEVKKTVLPIDVTKIKKIIPPNMLEAALKPLSEPLFPVISPLFWKGSVGVGSINVGGLSWNTPLREFSSSSQVATAPGHSWQNVATTGLGMEHRGMIRAAQIIYLTALEFMSNPDLVEKAPTVFNNTFKEKKYESSFPEGHKPPFHHFKNIEID